MNLDLDLVYPPLLEKMEIVFQDMWNVTGQKMKYTHGYRSPEAQAELFAQGRTKPGKIVTYSPAGSSWHEYGLAVDVAFKGPDPYLDTYADRNKLWEIFGSLAEQNGLVWGGRFLRVVDMPHIQWAVPFGIADAKELLARGGVRQVWQAIQVGRDVLT
jgi:peptidoglycan L-alanyl-D-glutamate endopeptidase CwlK